ncbi:hypothetical protein KAFR_0G03680 [Kazachstania africana CBS 2517]|uniref:BAR domain-containing protein n=1 Tax=Kazachstania africana (strain ATCC 22294 / BCRC 22015 / CBS 2517 / CECT 1963 / NBRC 1671 / NRRL Y-8276) TaxID=1071382 RepID=H2AYF1_KAZAF|nr:hypothetical protein KAFR_0G03680 [Kazachstania africana CBS 2517]CCF59401.1 hypothetical protein KAFR_0G03680 [Kazachstania africana CBS 2517]
MFSNFNFDKITNSISTAAQSAQQKINDTILTPDVQTKLHFKKTARFWQEKVGQIPDKEISKLPEGYLNLENKVDALEKILKRLLIVTKTYEIEGYDYPPNLSESLNDWWWSDLKKSKKHQEKSSFMNNSFPMAISKAAFDSKSILDDLKEKQQDLPKEGEEPEEEVEEEDDDEFLNLLEVFNSLSNCYKNIDKSKAEMDAMIVKEFNFKLEHLINNDFKKVSKLRTKVQDSRLEFDTLRHEIKLKELAQESIRQENSQKTDVFKEDSTKEVPPKEESTKEEQVNEESNKEETEKKKITEDKPAEDVVEKKTVEEQAEAKETEKPAKEGSSKEEAPKEDVKHNGSSEEETEEYKLLEKLEDEFVSNTGAAVELMTELTETSEVINLVKLFQNFQLIHYKQCVQEIENNMKFLDQLE